VCGRGARRSYREVYDPLVSVERATVPSPPGDPVSRRWVEQLHAGHPRYPQAVAALHEMLQRAALHELRRRRGTLAGQELEDVAQQCADDAVMSILGRLDRFQGLSRFTTWAYKFAVFEVSAKLARHAWRHHPPSAEELTWDRVPDTLAANPGERAERREQLAVVAKAVEQELTPRQREVFVAIALNDVPIDVLALQLGSNRNALYKNLFDARRRLRACLAAAGHPLGDEEARA
jgi:RNA polymerase sigma-70 factor, ECF subfamily